MALPMDYDSLRSDESSERANSLEDYKITCMQFIKDISKDYLAWVDYYKLPDEEDKKRRAGIFSTIERTNEWIAKIAQSIKSVDVVMNDGVQKMAESTAGKPFPIGVFVNKTSSYTLSKPGIIDVNVKATGREGRKTKLGFHFKDDRFRIESSCKAFIDEINLPQDEFDVMDLHLKLHAEECKQRDVISFTVTVSEMNNNQESDRRGVSTIIHIV
ncbi:MAG: hypothetical protein DWQ18_01930 [Crenarchaeota archaeon]|nr:MAG: hypothetical protein DWQ17_06600 [Thermoproteota archaeon]RDJ33708.1 MAG: hypothetical protein DWQ18_01930 [Thermoproteota archaeon]RDJ37288.1 MAG: hypothetical protein DWQ19_02140 [Thermoproteota archaeon]RDJ39242.1 MAG: hypothetical protein DWQ13_03030 [Thermoproteota archaeon]